MVGAAHFGIRNAPVYGASRPLRHQRRIIIKSLLMCMEDEKVIQIGEYPMNTLHDNYGGIFALTNHGRLFIKSTRDKAWHLEPLPLPNHQGL